MKRAENNYWLDDALTEAIGSEEYKANFEKWKQEHPEAVEMLTSRAGRVPSAFKSPLSIRKIIMKSPITKLAAAAVIVIAVLIIVDQIGGSKPAFAKVIENVTKAKSISFLSRQKLGIGPAIVSKMYLQGEKMRIDFIKMEGQAQGTKQLNEELQRRNLDAFMSYIADFEQKEGIELDHFRKTYKKINIDDRMVMVFTKSNLIEQFRDIEQEDAEWLSEESQDGRKIDVYLLKHVDLMGIKAELSGEEGERMRVWVDRDSRLPIRILLEASAHVEGKSKDWFEFSEFTWNEPLDEELFNLKAPEGYTLKEETLEPEQTIEK